MEDLKCDAYIREVRYSDASPFKQMLFACMLRMDEKHFHNPLRALESPDHFFFYIECLVELTFFGGIFTRH